jgi:hypothetical protein
MTKPSGKPVWLKPDERISDFAKIGYDPGIGVIIALDEWGEGQNVCLGLNPGQARYLIEALSNALRRATINEADEQARIEREGRERGSASFGRAIVSLHSLLSPNPAIFLAKIWDRDSCPDYRVETSRPYFKPDALRELAGYLNTLADLPPLA